MKIYLNDVPIDKSMLNKTVENIIGTIKKFSDGKLYDREETAKRCSVKSSYLKNMGNEINPYKVFIASKVYYGNPATIREFNRSSDKKRKVLK